MFTDLCKIVNNCCVFCLDAKARYTLSLKGRYNIGNVDKTASMSMLTLFESRYTLMGRYNIGNIGKHCFCEYAYSPC